MLRIAFDYLLTFNLRFVPLSRVAVLLSVFAICFLAGDRTLYVFDENDFDILQNALPRFLQPALRLIERVLIPTPKHLTDVRV